MVGQEKGPVLEDEKSMKDDGREASRFGSDGYRVRPGLMGPRYSYNEILGLTKPSSIIRFFTLHLKNSNASLEMPCSVYDKTVKVQDDLSKTLSCVQTMEGHTSFAVFQVHPNLPINVSGSEGETVKIWNSGIYRIENTR